MTVASDWEETTWQTHLDGHLSILSHSAQHTTFKGENSILEQALSCVGEDGGVHSFHSNGIKDELDEANSG
jgi:hypothetical protein